MYAITIKVDGNVESKGIIFSNTCKVRSENDKSYGIKKQLI